MKKEEAPAISSSSTAPPERAGRAFVSAILLRKSGMSREYIIAVFMKTASNPEAYLAQFAGEHPGIRLDVITPHERFMENFLAWLPTREI